MFFFLHFFYEKSYFYIHDEGSTNNCVGCARVYDKSLEKEMRSILFIFLSLSLSLIKAIHCRNMTRLLLRVFENLFFFSFFLVNRMITVGVSLFIRWRGKNYFAEYRIDNYPAFFCIWNTNDDFVEWLIELNAVSTHNKLSVSEFQHKKKSFFCIINGFLKELNNK